MFSYVILKFWLNEDLSTSMAVGYLRNLKILIRATRFLGRADQFRKIIVRYKRIGYNINIMRQSACLVFNPITVNNFASLFNCPPVGRASDLMMAPT